MSDQWQAPLPHGGNNAALAQWWAGFGDPTLVTLIQAAEADSPSLARAWARIESARASLASTESAAAPSLNASGSLTRSRQQLLGSQTSTQTSRSAGLDASWELDLFGKVRRNAEAAQARLDARVDDWHDARVSLAAEVADTYVQYRACHLLAQTYEQEAASMTQTATATRLAVEAGFKAPADGALARASLANTQSSLQAQRVQCSLLLKSLVNLTGSPEPSLQARLASGPAALPRPEGFQITAVPAQTLRQRPDIASLEREVAATSAEIGAARADLYPSLSLGGSVALSASNLTSGITTWSFGPALSIPLFDGGRRRAAVASAQASYQSAIAQWRQGVRSAVKEVEQALVNLDGASSRAILTAQAAQDYRTYLTATEVSWRAGNVSLLTLEEARRSALSAELQSTEQVRNQLQYWIALYKAVGGGWDPSLPATAPGGPSLP
ncbi:MAG: Solvent efflux pump outer membrane protein SrpC [Paracidovorax wautersii]|uniref:Solvent efflux pump outer membrane protein SrpC n=1 Tax=Paracidovorax wautersii TaxID=1177982 RepID=A0A7V8FN00_9BURK|nr:MAG: Solvent efflux pump outer membrane protein SrpC [Paracidovorax wautersii]